MTSEDHRRRRIPRERTLGERVARAFEMRHLTTSERNQRVTIVVAVVVLGLYLVLRPSLSGPSEGPRGGSFSPSAPAAPEKLGGYVK